MSSNIQVLFLVIALVGLNIFVVWRWVLKIETRLHEIETARGIDQSDPMASIGQIGAWKP